MRLGAGLRLRWIGRRLRHRGRPLGLVLAYHRVAVPDTDPWGMAVSPARFAEQLEALTRTARPVPLRDLVRALREGRPLRRAVALTFDDGYADVLHAARPLLERHGVPAAVFVTTGGLDSGREFWWDELERVLLQPGGLPEALALAVGRVAGRWTLDGDARYAEAAFQARRGWQCLPGREWDDPGPRQRLYRALHRLLRGLPPAEREEALARIRRWAGLPEAARPTHRPLSAEEVCRLAAGGLIEIGAHTETHPVLSALPADAQRREIVGSRARLEAILGRPVRHFAHPHGARADYTPETLRILGEAGFDSACSAVPDAVWRDSDPYALGRIAPGPADGESLARALRRLA